MFILDSISTYNPKDEREAQSIIERVTPRLAHANASVVLSSVKVNISFGSDSHMVCDARAVVGVKDGRREVIDVLSYEYGYIILILVLM